MNSDLIDTIVVVVIGMLFLRGLVEAFYMTIDFITYLLR